MLQDFLYVTRGLRFSFHVHRRLAHEQQFLCILHIFLNLHVVTQLPYFRIVQNKYQKLIYHFSEKLFEILLSIVLLQLYSYLRDFPGNFVMCLVLLHLSYSKCRESHINKPRLRTESIHHHDHHHALQHHPSSSSHSNDTNPSRQPRQMTHGLDSSSRSNGARLYHASNSRSAGGGPSTGGIGGSAAPCYDSRGLSPRASGYDWAGAGGHPVTAGGDGLAHGSAHRNHGLRGGSLSPRDMATYTYQDDTVADDRMNSPRRRSSPEGARSSDRDDALALWGLSALCQVACAAEGTSLSDDSRGRSDGFSRGPPSKAQRSFEDGEGNQPKRARREDFRLGWGTAGDGNGRDNETSDEVIELLHFGWKVLRDCFEDKGAAGNATLPRYSPLSSL